MIQYSEYAAKINYKERICKLVMGNIQMEDIDIKNPYEIGERIDRYLKKSQLGWISGQIHLRKKDILIQKNDGTIINKQDYRFEEGDSLLIAPILKQRFGSKEVDEKRSLSRQEATRILDKMMLFDNQNVAVLNKQAGYSVQGGLNPKTNLFSLMSSKYRKQLIHITHRLDKGTSGLVMFAKNKQTAQLIQTTMEERNTFSKFYLAQTEGSQILQKEGYIRANIEWTGKNKARLCTEDQKDSKDCITFYVPLLGQKLSKQQIGDVNVKFRNLIGIKLITGRKHQIRCHLSNYLGQAILNDIKYGGPKINEIQSEQKIYLHALGLVIKKRQIIDKIMAGSHSLNKSLGSFVFKDHQITFAGNMPAFWDLEKRMNNKYYRLIQKIQQIERQNRKQLPKKRNITTII